MESGSMEEAADQDLVEYKYLQHPSLNVEDEC